MGNLDRHAKIGRQVSLKRPRVCILFGDARPRATRLADCSALLFRQIFRLSNRLPLARGKTPEAVETGLEAIVPDAYRLHAHHWLILHGRYVCKARKPECGRCIIHDLCRYPGKTKPEATNDA